MNAAETRAAAELAGRAAAGVTELVHGVHTAVNRRVAGVTGPVAAPIHVLAGAMATGVYATVRLGLRAAAGTAGAASAARRALAPSAHETATARGVGAVAALNGAVGGLLAAEQNPWAIALRVEPQGERTHRIAVLLHGLGESDHSWRHDPDYRVLLRELGWTPVLVRYNTGRRIWENGADLAERLEALVSDWPTDPEQPLDLALIGHSMGGLVARAALNAAAETGSPWLGNVSRLITLGTPHEGAGLARVGLRTRTLLSRLPETRPLAALLDYGRTPGVDDLRAGTVTAPDQLPPAPLPVHIRVRTLAATLARSEEHPVSRVLGDLLVTAASATSAASGRRDAADRRHIGRLNHFDLLGHPEVGQTLHEWLLPG